MKQSRMIGLRLIATCCLILAIIEIFVWDATDAYFITTMILMASGLEAARFELFRIRKSLQNNSDKHA